jgi:hypothetical protein
MMVVASDMGRFIPKSTMATGLCRSRSHLLLQDDVYEIPQWHPHVRERELPVELETDSVALASQALKPARDAEAAAGVRWGLGWRTPLVGGKFMGVTLRPNREDPGAQLDACSSCVAR